MIRSGRTGGVRIHFRLAVAGLLAAGVLAVLLWAVQDSRAEAMAEYWSVCAGGMPAGCDFSTIQEAIDAAGAGDIIRVVGNSVYTENLVITKSLTLVGGCNTATCTLRLPGIFVTTLDGYGAGRAVTIEGEGSAITVTVDGFFITGGDAAGEARHPRDGGGVGSWNANLTLQRSVITDNVAARTSSGFGGGVYVDGGSVVISNTQVVSNQAGTSPIGYGGGIALHDTSGQVNDNLVQGNTGGAAGTGYGGGMNIEQCNDLVVTGNVIRDNTAAFSGSGYGGGIYVQQSTALTLTDNTLYANTGSVSHGGYGGGVNVYASHAFVSGNTLRENVSSRATHGYGGGMLVTESEVALDHNWVVSNTASLSQAVGMGSGGGLSFYTRVTATLSGDVVLSNTSSPGGNGNGIHVGSHVLLTATNIVVAKNHSSGPGGAVALLPGALPSVMTLVNSTVASNTHAGIWCSGSPTVTLVNLILWGNEDDVACTPVGYDDLSYSDVEDADGGTGVIHQDPLFVDAANNDFHLQIDSPCIDVAADPVTYPWVPGEDWDGDLRPGGSGYDIGADEFWARVYLPLVLRNL